MKSSRKAVAVGRHSMKSSRKAVAVGRHSMKSIVQWVLEDLSLLSTEIIMKSFKTCAHNLPVDGSQDSFIHCFKKDQPCEAGAT